MAIAPSSPSAYNDPALCQALLHHIQSAPHQRITFADYMQWVLYHPNHGYYSRYTEKIGPRGDFVTSPHLGSDFGELLARQLFQCWQVLDRPSPFYLVEMGAGQGLLAQDILRYLYQHYADCFQSVNYWIIETSPALVAEQRQRLQPWAVQGRVQWHTWDDIPTDAIVGCCFSNELVDAFPVHLLEKQGAGMQEVYVGLAADAEERLMRDVPCSGAFVEQLGDLSSDRLSAYFEQLGIDLSAPQYPEGYRTEVNLAAQDWLDTVHQRLKRGFLLTIDYGYTAARYYAPGRSQGTLQCYYQHAHHSDPYAHIGRQDLTAHVNFTDLERHGAHLGLTRLGFTQQGLFLMALGLGDRLAMLSQPDTAIDMQTLFQRREALHALINPMGLGNFGVLVQAKGLTPEEQATPLWGLSENGW